MTLQEDQKEFVEGIQASATGLLTIVNDILDFSKIESGTINLEEVAFDIATIVKNACRSAGVFAHQKHIAFNCKLNFPVGLGMVGDPGKVRQILLNLLTNAVKFTHEGSLTVTVWTCQVMGATWLKFAVKDTGIGIDEIGQRRLFEPFRQGDSSTARVYGGSGLGLVISRNV